jgi:hypothetical protein
VHQEGLERGERLDVFEAVAALAEDLDRLVDLGGADHTILVARTCELVGELGRVLQLGMLEGGDRGLVDHLRVILIACVFAPDRRAARYSAQS